jgi:uncharacterized repeat protein (TIGR03837 family)
MTPPASSQTTKTIALFCARIDHWGDLGVTWRLALALTARGHQVLWWVDDPAAADHFRAHTPRHLAKQIAIRHWHRNAPTNADRDQLAAVDAVVEAFGCGFCNAWLTALAERHPTPPAWVVLEHLAFGDWAAAVHGRASPHPSLPLTAYWCVPGFVPGSAGLPREPEEIAELDEWANHPHAVATWLATLTPVTAPERYRRVTLFCYPDAPLAPLLTQLACDPTPTLLFVPPGEPRQALARHGVVLGDRPNPWPGTPHLWQPIPFLAPSTYDRLLWSSHLNWVRGEDSFVRAQWAARPFLWSPYRRSDGGHQEFAAAFRAQFGGNWPLADCEPNFTKPDTWLDLWTTHAHWQNHCSAWRTQVAHLPVLADALLGVIAQAMR